MRHCIVHRHCNLIIIRVPGISTISHQLVSINPKSTQAFSGSRLALTCTVRGSPPPARIDWMHGRTPIDASSSTEWIIESLSGGQSQLVVPTLKAVHAGTYTCRAIWPKRSFQGVALVDVLGNGHFAGCVPPSECLFLLPPSPALSLDFSCSSASCRCCGRRQVRSLPLDGLHGWDECALLFSCSFLVS